MLKINFYATRRVSNHFVNVEQRANLEFAMLFYHSLYRGCFDLYTKKKSSEQDAHVTITPDKLLTSCKIALSGYYSLTVIDACCVVRLPHMLWMAVNVFLNSRILIVLCYKNDFCVRRRNFSTYRSYCPVNVVHFETDEFPIISESYRGRNENVRASRCV